MIPSYYRQPRRPARRTTANIPGERGIYYVRESSPYSLSMDGGLDGWFKSVTRAVSSGFKKAVGVAAKVATVAAKVTYAPTLLLAKGYAASGLPGGSKIGSQIIGTVQTLQKAPGTLIEAAGTAVRAPFVLAKGVTTGNIRGALKQVEQEARPVGKLAVKAAPIVLSVMGMPYVAAALSAVTTARDVYMANKESKLALAKMEQEIQNAYGTYVDAASGAGATPVSFDTFHAWAVAGGQGPIPLGDTVMQAGLPDGNYETPAAPKQETSIVPLVILGASMLK